MKNEATATATKAEKFWMLNNSGAVVAACEFDGIEAARAAAARWNQDETRPGLRVDIIQNGPTALGSTRVTAVA